MAHDGVVELHALSSGGGQYLSEADVLNVLKNAGSSLAFSMNKVDKGFVSVMERNGARHDRVYKDAAGAVVRNHTIKGAQHVRKKGLTLLRTRWAQLLRGFSAGTIARMRRFLEFGERKNGSRALRLRVG